ncbi:hypothetical protein PENSUB_5824 [Penicillium subrubescens]|uniref:Uncharacterized protein n=2 Tax=Penicillium subrubescens TaxID=1316194 RepID=A0A1Q5UQK6_9EURO|nr:hypothetical protein PENSUB_5824 [Penicillium subrubescens]
MINQFKADMPRPLLASAIISGQANYTWVSRAEAATHFKKQFKTWDPRVLERWLQYGLHGLPGSDTVTP